MYKTDEKIIGAFDQKDVKLISLENSFLRVEILNFGCTIHSITIKELDHDIVVGPKNLEGYLQQYNGIPYYFGATVGRYAGRISNGGFVLNEKKYPVKGKDGIHLHGGKNGLHQKNWKVEEVSTTPCPKVVLSCKSMDMEEGYPGNITVFATIELTNDNILEVEYNAVSDKDSILNLTNHTYFNLGIDSIQNHSLKISSDTILDCTTKLIPNGKKINIEKTTYDYGRLKPMHELSKTNGLDTTFCFKDSSLINTKVIYYAPSSGIEMKVSSNQKCAVVFAPKNLSFVKESKNRIHETLPYPSICFEMQNYPDAPNNPSFPSSVIKKGERYISRSIYEFNQKS